VSDERGFALAMVLVTFLLVGVLGLGALSVVTSDLHGAVANELAVQAMNVAEAGLDYAGARLAAGAVSPVPTDERYEGEPDDLPLTRHDGSEQGTFRAVVRCVYPADAIPPACLDDAATAWVDERDLRRVISTGFVPRRPGRARRRLEAVLRRYGVRRPDVVLRGICGRDGVELGPGTTVIADVASNGDVVVDGPRRPAWTVGYRSPRAPPSAPAVEAIPPSGSQAGLTGTYTWRVTFVDAAGKESGGGPSTQVSFLTAQQALLTVIPLGDRSIVRRRIYRTLQNSAYGPWFLVGEIADDVTQEFTDGLADEALRWRLADDIQGSVTAAGNVVCSQGCGSQVAGPVHANVRSVVCPAFTPPRVQTGAKPAPNPIVQTAITQTVRWSAIRAAENEVFTIETLSEPNAALHIHLRSIVLDRNAVLVVTGPGTVYIYLEGDFVLGPGAVFGAVDSDGHLLRPSDRLQVLSVARDPWFPTTAAASVRWERGNRVSALVFAPHANIVVDQAVAVFGGLYGRYIRITRSSGIFLDPAEGLGSELTLVRPSPFQYVLRWYDNPNPVP
jgi:hypothetical protein